MNLEGVDVEWVRDQLSGFLQETEPIYDQSNSHEQVPSCSRGRLIELMEVIKPILDRLYPNWERENAVLVHDYPDSEPYQDVRDACRRLKARLETQADLVERLGGLDTSPRMSASSLHPLIWKAAAAQWSTGHRHEAVLAAAKAVNSMLQKKTGRRDVSETDLVKQTFSDKDPEPGKPRLRYASISNDQTARSMRVGVMDFGAGCFGAIRNPIGHLPNDELELDEQSALERLCALSLLARWIDEADLATVSRAPVRLPAR